MTLSLLGIIPTLDSRSIFGWEALGFKKNQSVITQIYIWNLVNHIFSSYKMFYSKVHFCNKRKIIFSAHIKNSFLSYIRNSMTIL